MNKFFNTGEKILFYNMVHKLSLPISVNTTLVNTYFKRCIFGKYSVYDKETPELENIEN